MELDGTTFALEIINFLVLVWLLQRLLYKPVTAAIAARQAGIERTLSEARAVRGDADALKRQYEHRMADWEREKALARQQLQAEMEGERTRQLAALQAALDEERERQRALDARRATEEGQRLAEAARTEGAGFVTRLLSRLASASLEERIHQVLLEDLPHLPDRERQALRAAAQVEAAKITSAYPLSEAQRASLTDALASLAGRPVACEFGQDPELTAGLRVGIGAWVLRASLRDEMRFFVEATHDGAR